MNNVSGTAAACLCGQTVDLLLMWNTSEGSSLTLNRKNGKLEIYIIVNLLRHKQVLSLYQQQLIYIVSRFEPLLNILTVIKACSLRYWRILSLLVTLCSVSATGCQLPLPLFFHFLCPAFHLCLPPVCFFFLFLWRLSPHLPKPPLRLHFSLLFISDGSWQKIIRRQTPSTLPSYSISILCRVLSLSPSSSPSSSAVIVSTVKGLHGDHARLDCVCCTPRDPHFWEDLHAFWEKSHLTSWDLERRLCNVTSTWLQMDGNQFHVWLGCI